MDYKEDIQSYFGKVKATIDKISIEDLNTLMNILNKARDENRFVFICGNGVHLRKKENSVSYV